MSDASEATEILNEFLVESYDRLDQLDQDLVDLETRGASADLLARVLRCVHTIKGTCGFFGFAKLESITHVGESLLLLVRRDGLPVPAELVSTLLMFIDAARDILQHIERYGDEGPSEHNGLIDNAARLTVGMKKDTVDERLAPSSEGPLIGEVLVQQGHASTADIAAAVHEQRNSSTRSVGEILVARGVTTAHTIRSALDLQQLVRHASLTDKSIRVDVGLLEHLMRLAGELSVTRDWLQQRTPADADQGHQDAMQRLHHVISALQDGLAQLRMQRIGTIWRTLPRVVRDLALQCDKRVVMVMEGADTELDRTIIDAIKDPLLHMVRNAVDHGIETAMHRVLAGKQPEGRLRLLATQDSIQIHIEIIDDGAGINPAHLRTTAIAKGFLTVAEAATLSDRDVLDLVFAPGFSTATATTMVSGRGVGMDVVRTNVRAIGGTVDISSVVGVGTKFRISLPKSRSLQADQTKVTSEKNSGN